MICLIWAIASLLLLWGVRGSSEEDLVEFGERHTKEMSPKLEGLMLKLKLQYFGHLM